MGQWNTVGISKTDVCVHTNMVHPEDVFVGELNHKGIPNEGRRKMNSCFEL